MTNPITDATVALTTALNSVAYPAVPVVPEDILVPAIVAQAGEPYLDDDETTFGEKALHIDLWLLVELVTNEQASADLDAMLAHVLAYLPGTWGLDEVGRPGPVSTANWLAHGMRVSVSSYITL